ncbi:substrate-binding periplasmic protein [Wielerella bovis]|uniref:substrate-binding periplasmic protein n=1 Tax=Wielerella bovis TaxID=2917790 RepID=UPI002018495E|nr:ABC transporter substrate-binding protein [Wielerella bovis]ULJ64404.1 ABC transporter substrate-binding protein [Wielerella bovis]ULJ66683.1 ABC transporter substrate-binding protein [Wielerella bovis]
MKPSILSTLILPVVLLAACNDAPPAAQEQNKSAATTETVAGSATATVQESNNGGETYIVMSQPSYPPFATRGDKGEMIGLDMDLLNAIAKKEGFSLKFIPHAMTGLLETVNEGEADIVATGVNITPEREQLYTFSKSYFDAKWVAIVDKQQNQFNSFDDLRGKPIAVQKASLSETQLKASGITDKPVLVDTVYMGLTTMAQGNAVATYDVDAVLNTYLKPDASYYTLVDEKSGTIPFGWVLKKGNTELKAKLDKGIDDLKADGTYQQIIDKWYPKAAQ